MFFLLNGHTNSIATKILTREYISKAVCLLNTLHYDTSRVSVQYYVSSIQKHCYNILIFKSALEEIFSKMEHLALNATMVGGDFNTIDASNNQYQGYAVLLFGSLYTGCSWVLWFVSHHVRYSPVYL